MLRVCLRVPKTHPPLTLRLVGFCRLQAEAGLGGAWRDVHLVQLVQLTLDLSLIHVQVGTLQYRWGRGAWHEGGRGGGGKWAWREGEEGAWHEDEVEGA